MRSFGPSMGAERDEEATAELMAAPHSPCLGSFDTYAEARQAGGIETTRTRPIDYSLAVGRLTAGYRGRCCPRVAQFKSNPRIPFCLSLYFLLAISFNIVDLS
jgi:hypothetical protein